MTGTCGASSVVSAAEAAGIGHLVFLSSAGLGRASKSEHFTARVASERLVEESGVPHTIVRTTHLFESVRHVSRSRPRVDLRLPRLIVQPIAARDVAEAVAGIAMDTPRGDVVALAGPECFRLDDLVSRDRLLRFFHRDALGAEPSDPDRIPFDGEPRLRSGRAEITSTRFADWAADMATSSGTLLEGRRS